MNMFNDFFENQFNAVLVEYYVFLLCWFPLAFNGTFYVQLVLVYQDDLAIEDWKSAFGMMLAFNNILMIELSKYLEEK